ncbi:transposase [Marinobacter sp.]|uniref:transposase n=1 Tax=Marinobacter sp. TaxID=50741 RepID=UPI0035650682
MGNSGICPDHANIGRFIALHDDLIAGPFFEALTRSVLRETGSAGECLAGDGTVVEAAASHYGLLKVEAAQQKAEDAQRQAQDDPDDLDKQGRAEQAQRVHHTLERRSQRRQARGKSSGQLRISPQEPDALVQPLKRGRGMAPAYKPSILANESRVVVGHVVDPSNEVAVLPGLLTQSRKVTGAMPGELLLDAGYWADAVIETSLTHDISLLCPEGRTGGKRSAGSRLYPKSDFCYSEFDDSYRCPAGARMVVIGRWAGNEKSPAYTLYGTPACNGCEHRAQCTRNKKGRRLKRYDGDEAKEALRQVMCHPKAKRRFSRRPAMVEPVFSVMRGLQGLNRFRRKGLAAVRTEFALHVLAYNLGRALACRLFVAPFSGHTVVLALLKQYFAHHQFIAMMMNINNPNPGKVAHAELNLLLA